MSKIVIRKRHKRAIIISVALFVLLLGFGVPQFAFAYVRCGFKPPVQISGYWINFAPSFETIEDESYGPHVLNGYVCTVDEAYKRGFEPSPASVEDLRRDNIKIEYK